MKIALITPYPPASRNGNAHTAMRWRRFLRAAGHRVNLETTWDGAPCDAMIALHARRSYASIAAFSERHPGKPLVVVLTGTDLYRDIDFDPDAQASLALADKLVVLQPRGTNRLTHESSKYVSVIYQSSPARKPLAKPTSHFSAGCVAHLREEKDPFRLADAVALLPTHSHIRAWHIGGALQDGMAEDALRRGLLLHSWRWLGAKSHGETRRRIARSHLLVVSSRMEGGANVICEATTAGTPLLASAIEGNIGMLGEDYAGYFPYGDSNALAELLLRCEQDPRFYAHLAAQCAARAPLFSPTREANAVCALFTE